MADARVVTKAPESMSPEEAVAGGIGGEVWCFLAPETLNLFEPTSDGLQPIQTRLFILFLGRWERDGRGVRGQVKSVRPEQIFLSYFYHFSRRGNGATKGW